MSLITDFEIFKCKYFVDILSNGGGEGYELSGLARFLFYNFLFYSVATLLNKPG